MNTSFAPLAALLAGVLISSASAQTSTRRLTAPGPETLRQADRVWVDRSRGDRSIAVRIYAPAPRRGLLRPLVVFSHGLGGDQLGYAYFGKHLASHGFVVIHLNHPGSDSVVASEGILRLAMAGANPRNAVLRPQDVSFVLDQVELLRNAEPLLSQVDLAKIGVAGHSLGAYTALAVVGQTIERRGRIRSFEDARVKCALAMSIQGAGVLGLTPQSWDGIRVPVHTLTGTKDLSLGTKDPAERRQAFDSMAPGQKYHLTIKDAEHHAFGDRTGPRVEHDPRHHGWIQAAAAGFFRSTLMGERAATRWLNRKGLERTTRGEVVQEAR